MKRLFRRLFRLAVSGLCLLSLLSCGGVGWMWWRSYRIAPGGEDRVSRYVARRQARYTVRSAQGSLTLFGPPPGQGGRLLLQRRTDSGGLVGETAETLAGNIKDDQIQWKQSPIVAQGVGAHVKRDTPLGWARMVVEGSARRDLTPALLAALESGDQVLAAHVLLLLAYRRSSDGLQQQRRADGSVAFRLGGMQGELRARGPADRIAADVGPEPPEYSARVDPTQLPAIRDQWHSRLDVPVRSIRHWQVMAVTALLPLLWSGLWLRRASVRRRGRRQGLCLKCGYDLRATPHRCPECGTPVTVAVR